MKPALVVIDLQEWFREDHPGPFWEPLLENTARSLEAMRQRAVPVVHVVTRYRRDRSDWPAAWQFPRGYADWAVPPWISVLWPVDGLTVSGNRT